MGRRGARRRGVSSGGVRRGPSLRYRRPLPGRRGRRRFCVADGMARGARRRSVAACGRGGRAAGRPGRRVRPPDPRRRPRARPPDHRRLAPRRAHPRLERRLRVGRPPPEDEPVPGRVVVLRRGAAALRPRGAPVGSAVRRRRRRAHPEPHRRALPRDLPALHGGPRPDGAGPGGRHPLAPLARRVRPGAPRRHPRRPARDRPGAAERPDRPGGAGRGRAPIPSATYCSSVPCSARSR